MEKILVKRLHHYPERENRSDQYQCDVCPAKSTLDNLLYLQEEIHLDFHRKQNITCIFFDVQKAFNRLLPTIVLQVMQKFNVTDNILSSLCNFLQHRTFHVRIGQKHSTTISQQTGTPQGSVLSPVLFILALNFVSEIMPHTVQYLLYADDLVIFLKHTNPYTVTQQL